MADGFRILDHTADTGIEASGTTWPGALRAAVEGMLSLMYGSSEGVHHQRSVTTTVRASDRHDLVVETLSEVLWRAEAEDTAFRHCDVVSADEGEAVVVLSGGPIADAVLVGPPIKAVTYHGLEVDELDGGWQIRVIFDV